MPSCWKGLQLTGIYRILPKLKRDNEERVDRTVKKREGV